MNNITDPAIRNCTSCQMCSAVCPTGAISIKFDEEGFYAPTVDNNKCISCGLCKSSCYKYDEKIKCSKSNNTKTVFAAKSKDSEILSASTSGGIASHIAKECIRQGYMVVGVGYDYELDIASNYIASNEEQLDAFRGSKYMQSYTEETFKKLISDKTDQKYAVFGTPCHIYSIKEYAKRTKQEDRFLLIDLFCHGCPSYFLWNKYINKVKKKLDVPSFEAIEFRSKRKGWHEFCHYFKNDEKEYSSRKINDPYYTIFFDNAILCKSCYDCEVRSTLEYSDIRIGDFWGTEYALNTEGVSAVVISSEKGNNLFNSIISELYIKSHALEEVTKFQSYGLEYKINKEVRDKAINLLKSDMNINTIFSEYQKTYPLSKRIKLLFKKIIYILPSSFRNYFKKTYMR